MLSSTVSVSRQSISGKPRKETLIWVVPLKTPMTNVQSQPTDLERRVDGGTPSNFSEFIVTQLLTNGQKQIVLLDKIDKKLYVLINKTNLLSDLLSGHDSALGDAPEEEEVN